MSKRQIAYRVISILSALAALALFGQVALMGALMGGFGIFWDDYYDSDSLLYFLTGTGGFLGLMAFLLAMVIPMPFLRRYRVLRWGCVFGLVAGALAALLLALWLGSPRELSDWSDWSGWLLVFFSPLALGALGLWLAWRLASPAPLIDQSLHVKRPGWIWAIVIWYFVVAVTTMIAVFSFFTLPYNSQRAYLGSAIPFKVAIAILLAVIEALAAVLLFLFRKQALYLFCGALILTALLFIWYGLIKGGLTAMGYYGMLGVVFSFGLLCAVCIYSWWLTKKRVLV